MVNLEEDDRLPAARTVVLQERRTLQTNRIRQLEAALRWVRKCADDNYEQDLKLRSQGARTLKRISDKCTLTLETPPIK